MISPFLIATTIIFVAILFIKMKLAIAKRDAIISDLKHQIKNKNIALEAKNKLMEETKNRIVKFLSDPQAFELEIEEYKFDEKQ